MDQRIEDITQGLVTSLTKDFQLDYQQMVHLKVHLSCFADLVQQKRKYDKTFGFPLIVKKVRTRNI